MPDTAISALTALDQSTADHTKTYVPLFHEDGSPLNRRMNFANVRVSFLYAGTSASAARFSSAGNGIVVLTNNAGTDLSRVCFGGTTSLFPAWKRSGANMHLRLADDSAFGNLELAGLTATSVSFSSAGTLSWNSDLTLQRTAADRLALQRTTNAQRFEVYRTHSSSSNFERGVISWYDSASDNGTAGTTLRIGTEKGSVGGTARALGLITDGVERLSIAATGNIGTTSSQLAVTPAWSGTGVATTPLLVNVTADPGPASANSLLFDFQLTGSSVIWAHKNGLIRTGNVFIGGTSYVGVVSGNCAINYSSTDAVAVGNGGIRFGTGIDAPDLTLFRTDADRLALRRTTNAQRFEVYRTYSAADNFERGVISWYDSASDNGTAGTTLRIGTEKGSIGGTARDLELITDGTARLTIGTTGIPSFASDQIRVTTAKTPSSASDTGVTGSICWDASYVYVCTATNTWRRIAHATW